MFGIGIAAIVSIIVALTAIISIRIALNWRRVVKTNQVHVVQSRRKTTSYGKDQDSGNVYYAWPSWFPRIGVTVIELPMNVFKLKIDSYDAYDKERVPFEIDIVAFFRVKDSNMAAQRISSIQDMEQQLTAILQGASRSILAGAPINEILEKRNEYGDAFTRATEPQLEEWGIINVKNIELMDIRDKPPSKAIENIMSMKLAEISKNSRVAIATNMQEAQTKEIAAKQAVNVAEQEAAEVVGKRTALKTQQIGIAEQQAQQAIKVEEADTATKTMAVQQVNQVRAAEIARNVQVVQADQDKQTQVIRAEGEKQRTITVADGQLEQAKRNAEATRVQGEAKGVAEQAVLMAPVNSQIALAKEIGENEGYQKYLVTVRTIEKDQTVGVQQAEALKAANIKVIATSGNVNDGVKGVMDILTPQGGMRVGAMLDAISNTEVGKRITDALAGNGAGHRE